jgi:siroheme decarboxylase
MAHLSPKEKAILRDLQRELPLSPRPYAVLARRHGLSERALIERVRRYARTGIIRRIGVIFNLAELGVRSTLVALRVPASRVPAAARIINRFPHVSHNYVRDDRYNVWFTLSARSARRLSELVRDIRGELGACDLLDLRTTTSVKARAVFDLAAEGR